MEVKFSVDRKKFEKFLKAIKTVREEANIDINKEEKKLETLTVDPGHIYLIHSTLPTVKVNENTRITFDVDKCLRFLKAINDETINITVKEKKMWIGDKIGIGLLEDIVDNTKIPDLQYDIKTDYIDLRELKNILITGSTISNTAKFIAKDGKLTVKIEGDADILNFEICKAEGEGKALYSIDILNYLLKAMDTGRIAFSTDKPLKIESCEDGLYIMYLLAPRVE